MNATKTRCILILLASVMQYQNLVIFNLEDSLQDIFVLFSQDGFEYSCPKGFDFLVDPLPERICNSHYGNGVPAMFTSQCCPAEG